MGETREVAKRLRAEMLLNGYRQDLPKLRELIDGWSNAHSTGMERLREADILNPHDLLYLENVAETIAALNAFVALLGAPVPAGPQRIERECGCVDSVVTPNDGRTVYVARTRRCERHPLFVPAPEVGPMEDDPPLARIRGYLVDTEPEREGS